MFFSPLLLCLPPFHFLHYVSSSRLWQWSWMLMRPSAACPQTELFKVISPGSQLPDLLISLPQPWKLPNYKLLFLRYLLVLPSLNLPLLPGTLTVLCSPARAKVGKRKVLNWQFQTNSQELEEVLCGESEWGVAPCAGEHSWHRGILGMTVTFGREGCTYLHVAVSLGRVVLGL